MREVVKFGTIYYAYYSCDYDNEVHYATSDDGVHFIERGLISKNGKYLQALTSHSYDQTDFIFSVWREGNHTYYGISTDGINFSIHPNPIAVVPIEHKHCFSERWLNKVLGGLAGWESYVATYESRDLVR